MNPTAARTLAARGPLGPEAILEHCPPGTNVIVPIANGEPVTVIRALDEAFERLEGVTVHGMHAMHDHAYFHRPERGRLGSHLLLPLARHRPRSTPGRST